MNTATVKRLVGINALFAWFGYLVAEITNVLQLVPPEERYVPGSHAFGGSADGLAGAIGRVFDSHGYFTTWSNLLVTNSPVLPLPWTDTNASKFPSRFYRVLLGP